MKTSFAEGDENGNRGTVLSELSPAELQAAWEIDSQSRFTFRQPYTAWPTQEQFHVRLAYGGQEAALPIIPDRSDAVALRRAIRSGARRITRAGRPNPPTVEEIRGRIQERLNTQGRS